MSRTRSTWGKCHPRRRASSAFLILATSPVPSCLLLPPVGGFDSQLDIFGSSDVVPRSTHVAIGHVYRRTVHDARRQQFGPDSAQWVPGHEPCGGNGEMARIEHSEQFGWRCHDDRPHLLVRTAADASARTRVENCAHQAEMESPRDRRHLLVVLAERASPGEHGQSEMIVDDHHNRRPGTPSSAGTGLDGVDAEFRVVLEEPLGDLAVVVGELGEGALDLGIDGDRLRRGSVDEVSKNRAACCPRRGSADFEEFRLRLGQIDVGSLHTPHHTPLQTHHRATSACGVTWKHGYRACVQPTPGL